jgi:hypothetical protein
MDAVPQATGARSAVFTPTRLDEYSESDFQMLWRLKEFPFYLLRVI